MVGAEWANPCRARAGVFPVTDRWCTRIADNVFFLDTRVLIFGPCYAAAPHVCLPRAAAANVYLLSHVSGVRSPLVPHERHMQLINAPYTF